MALTAKLADGSRGASYTPAAKAFISLDSSRTMAWTSRAYFMSAMARYFFDTDDGDTFQEDEVAT